VPVPGLAQEPVSMQSKSRCLRVPVIIQLAIACSFCSFLYKSLSHSGFQASQGLNPGTSGICGVLFSGSGRIDDENQGWTMGGIQPAGISLFTGSKIL
jgi:hypothetical protein